jgi:hypothetical protein
LTRVWVVAIGFPALLEVTCGGAHYNGTDCAKRWRLLRAASRVSATDTSKH